jgi:hypothetical protein
MADPVLAGNVLNTRIGPAWLLVGDTFDALKCLGLTQDGVTLSGEPETNEVEWDQIDSPIVNITQLPITIEANLGEMTKANMEEVILGGYRVFDPAFSAGTDDEQDKEALFVMGSLSDKDPLDFAKILIIHPKKNPWTNRSETIVFEKAYPLTGLNMQWGKTAPRLMNVSFRAVPYAGPTGVERTFVIGDYAKIEDLLDT